MTTPAQKTRDSLFMAQNYESWPSWNPSNVSKTTSPRPTGASIQERPASGTSPIRTNGTRAPRGWRHTFGDIRTTPASFEIKNKAGQKSTCYRGTVNSSFSTSHVDQILPWSVGKAFFPVGVESSARTKALAKLAGGRAEFGAALGEMRQTARGITSAASSTVGMIDRLANTYRRSRRAVVEEIRNFGKPPRPPKGQSPSRWKQRGEEIRGRWLEYQMGLKPLLGDIEDAGQALSDALFDHKQDMLMTIKAGASSTERVELPNSGPSAPIRYRTEWDVTSSCHISAVYRVPISATRTINELGLGNPASVAWELTQFSWMVDYLVGVGEWLESMTADTGTSFLEGSISKIQIMEPAVEEVSLVRNTDEWVRKPRFRIRGRAGCFQREVLSGRILPSVVPAIRNRVGLTQMANVLSVLSQMGKK